MLLPEQVVPFLLHDDAIVRNHALGYFRDTHDFGPLTADHFWAAIDKFGENDKTLGFASQLNDVPQTAASLQRLLKALAATPSEDFDFHYQHAARDMDLKLAAEYREELLACPKLLAHVREHLELRLSLIDRPPEEAWNRLMEHGRELGNEYADRINYSQSNALIEAAARGGAAICEQALAKLNDDAAAEDWRQIFAVKVLGAARYESAVDALVDLLAIDADVLRGEVNRALARIGTTAVIDRLVGFYPGKPWHVRLYAYAPLANIKRPESVPALLTLLEWETELETTSAHAPDFDDETDLDDDGELNDEGQPDEEHDLEEEGDPDAEDELDEDFDLDAEDEEEEGQPLVDWIMIGLTDLCSLVALDQSRELIEEFPDDPELLELAEGLLATALMTGVTLPEETFWRRQIKRRDAGIRSSSVLEKISSDLRENWRKTGIHSPPNSPDNVDDPPAFLAQHRALNQGSHGQDREFEGSPEPYRNPEPKISRNDPCPCGSGKKYKKCCGK